MSKVSVIVPARHELYLKETVNDLLAKAAGEVEVIVVLDGYWPPNYPADYPTDDPRLVLVHREKRGMRASINAGAAIARGEYLMKIDAHCAVVEGYDEILKKDCDKDWIVIPRRYSLDPDAWSIRQHRPFVDYEYLSWPYRPKTKVGSNEIGLHDWVWDARIAGRIDHLLDETMTFQGSCWFTPKAWFEKRIGQMSEEGYGTFIGEAQELGLKTWLGGGKVMVNKQAWYAHLWKGEPYRQKYLETFGVKYTRLGPSEFHAGNQFNVDYWMENRWAERQHDLAWLIERFWPVPSWPEDRSLWRTRCATS